MTEQAVHISVAQRIIIRFFVNEGAKPSDILQRLQAQYGESTLSKTQVFEWCKKFKEGRTTVENLPHERRPKTSTTQTKIDQINELILANRRISVLEMSQTLQISVGSVEEIVHKHLHYRKVCARWVPRLLTMEQKLRRVEVSTELLRRYHDEGDAFLNSLLTCDETWVHHFTPESKRSSLEWRHSNSPKPKKAKVVPSAGKVMATVFWDSEGVLLTDFLKERRTVNALYYSDLLIQKVKPAFRSKRRNRSIRSVILLHDNARPHTAQMTTNVLEKMHWEILPHPPYSPDLSPCDFHLFGPLKEALGGSKFQDDDDVAEFVQEWLCAQPKTFYKNGIMKLPQRWQKCIELEGEYVEK